MTTTCTIDTLIHLPCFLEPAGAEALFSHLVAQTPWTQSSYFKRKVCSYQGTSAELNRLLLHVQTSFRRPIAGAFLNYYEDGNDYAPYHADKYNCDSCLVSLGACRTLRFKHNDTKENTDFDLNSGDLLFVPDEIHRSYKHSLLKRTKVTEPRISVLIFFQG